MKMNTVLSISLIVISALLLTSVWDGCNKGKRIELLKTGLEKSQEQTNKLGQTVYSLEVQVMEKDDQLKEYTDSIFALGKKHEKQIKQIHAYYGSRTKVELDTVLVPYKDTAGMKDWEDSIALSCGDVIQYYEDSTIKIGTTASDSTAYYKVDMTVLKKGIQVNNLQFVDSQHVRFTSMKGGLFKRNAEGKLKFHVKPRMKVEVLHTNPYFVNTGIDATFIEPPKKKGQFLKGVIIGGTVIYTFTELLPLIL
jgi:hypothetical protein